jgi:hypothetical protein
VVYPIIVAKKRKKIVFIANKTVPTVKVTSLVIQDIVILCKKRAVKDLAGTIDVKQKYLFGEPKKASSIKIVSMPKPLIFSYRSP